MKKAPKNPRSNIVYRRELLLAASEDDDFKNACWQRASTDIVWWCDSFLWTYSPKEFDESPNRPFVLWDYQETAIRKINDAIGSNDLMIEKSRDMGASWLCLAAFMWRWMFFERQSFLMGSRKQELVDKSGDPKSLYWKADMILESLPGWMIPRHTRTSMHLHNEENGSTIDGESTNDDFARGDRRTAILLDEFPAVIDNGHNILAATRDATNCRIFNGTPQGSSGAYYDTRKKIAEQHPDRLLRMHWTMHPLKKRGLYTTHENLPNAQRVILDKGYRFPPDFHFIPDGKVRSPWYDEQCLRAAHPQEIAQELDIDYAASGWQFFDGKVLADLVREMARPPIYVGEIAHEPKGEEPRFDVMPNGRMKFWCSLDGQGEPEKAEYVVGCDIATGKGGEMSSNSVASVANRKTGQKVAQFTGNTIEPYEFATYAEAICKLFKNKDGGPALLIWEENGPGMQFSRRVREDGFRHVFMRESETDFYRKKTQKAGWYSNKDSKKNLLADYQEALSSKLFWNPCEEALLECGDYVHLPDGTIEHSRARGNINPTAAGESHGDMVIADALVVRGIKDRGGVQSEKADESTLTCPPGSYAFRRREWEKSKKKTRRY